MTQDILNVDDAHQVILEEAARIANQNLANSMTLADGRGEPLAVGQVYRADPLVSERGGLCLSMDEMVTKGRRNDQILLLHEIGRNAIREAIVSKYPELFAGIIIGEMKQGRNYFARFQEQYAQQLRLF